MRDFKKFNRILAGVLWAALSGWPSLASGLSLEDYLDQVRSGNGSWNAALLAERASLAQAAQARLLTSPSLFAEAEHADDKSPQIEAALYGDRRQRDFYRLGLQSQTGFGLSGRLGHETFRYQIEGASPLFLPLTNYYTARTFLELRQDLWRNGFGAEIRDTQAAIAARAEADSLQSRFQARQLLVQAEVVYWRLAAAREAVRIQQDLLDRAQQLEDWTAGRVRLKLLDAADLMQAQSQTQARKLELANSQDQAQMALQAFNTLRAAPWEAPAEGVVLPLDASRSASALAEAPPERLDLRALAATSAASRRRAGLQRQQVQPELQATLGLAWNGLDQGFGQAFEDAWNHRQYTYAAGLSLTLPLDLWTARAALSEGYDLEAEAAEQLLAQRRLEAQHEWQELRRRLADVQNRLALARDLESLQRKKAEHERLRLRRGNSVTFQVLQFEQDWGQSQLARVAVESVMLEILAQAKLYQE